MSLSSLGLDAFFEVAKAGSFSLAAKVLHVTQSALSQRIKNLEGEAKTTLFIRDSSGAHLTEAGQRLLRYCQIKEGLEKSALAELSPVSKTAALTGHLRITGYSSILRSLIMPSLDPLLKQNPSIHVELMKRELREIPAALKTGACDLAFSNQELSLPGVVDELLGYEENILVAPIKSAGRETTYLDHDPEDRTTLLFFSSQGKKMEGQRSYLGENYAILDGVAMGWGRAVVAKHLLKNYPGIRAVPGYKPLRLPIYLSYYESPFAPRLAHEAIAALQKTVPALLARK